MNKQLKKVELFVIKHATLENNRAYLLRTEITKSHLDNRICQHCGVKTSMVIPSFYYVFTISLSCNINIPSFIGNLWWVLLLGNNLNVNQLAFSILMNILAIFLQHLLKICVIESPAKHKQMKITQ